MRCFRLVHAPATLAAALALCLACLSPPRQGCVPPGASDGSQLTVERRADHSLIGDATVRLLNAAPVYLEYGNDQVGWLRTPTTAAGSIHQLPIVRLRAETTYEVRAFSLDAGGCATGVAMDTFTSGRLPPELDGMRSTSSGQPSFPLALMDYRPPNSEFRWLIGLDSSGVPIWYHRIPIKIESRHVSVTVTQRANGNLLYLLTRYGVQEITPAGEVVRDIRLTGQAASEIHHELLELPDGRVLFLGREVRTVHDSSSSGAQTRPFIGDTLHVLDLENGLEEKLWSTFDVLEPSQRPAEWQGSPNREEGLDWTHGNTINLGPRGNLILSFRRLNQVISLSPDLKTVEWKLGGPGSSFSFPDPDDRFYGQHTPYELPGERILLFDNGNFRPKGEYSRVLELKLDFTTMTARRVWDYRPRPDVFSPEMCNIVRLPNGNTLVNFGFRDGPGDPILLREVQPDKKVAWEQSMSWKGARVVRYRAHPWSSLAGEATVMPTPLGAV